MQITIRAKTSMQRGFFESLKRVLKALEKSNARECVHFQTRKKSIAVPKLI